MLHPTVPCESNEFSCVNGYGCLDESQICDRYQLCMDASDEQNCTGRKGVVYRLVCENEKGMFTN